MVGDIMAIIERYAVVCAYRFIMEEEEMALYDHLYFLKLSKEEAEIEFFREKNNKNAIMWLEIE